MSINTWARPSGNPAATQRSQNPDKMSVSEVPARPAWVSHADNSMKEASFISGLYRRSRPLTTFAAPQRYVRSCNKQTLRGDRRSGTDEPTRHQRPIWPHQARLDFLQSLFWSVAVALRNSLVQNCLRGLQATHQRRLNRTLVPAAIERFARKEKLGGRPALRAQTLPCALRAWRRNRRRARKDR